MRFSSWPDQNTGRPRRRGLNAPGIPPARLVAVAMERVDSCPSTGWTGGAGRSHGGVVLEQGADERAAGIGVARGLPSGGAVGAKDHQRCEL